MLLLAPCHRGQQLPTPGAVFTAEMICEATIDRIMELLKLINSGNAFLVISLNLFIKCFLCVHNSST